MKERARGFAAGILATTLVGALGFTALAATGQVTFNASALSLNGTQVSAKGENYTLDNGQSVPASITYTDEKGGGTTYLPVRRISELLGVETGWDGTTGSVTIGSAALPSQPPVTTTPPTNYSDWSKEDEAAYQEFKALWEVEMTDSKTDDPDPINNGFVYDAKPKDVVAATDYWSHSNKDRLEIFLERLFKEYSSLKPEFYFRLYFIRDSNSNFALIMGKNENASIYYPH